MRTVLLFLLLCSTASARIVQEAVPYDHNGVPLEGLLVYSDATEDKRPGILLFHDWMGIGDDEIDRAKSFAAEGYVVFLPDMFGTAVRPRTAAEASEATREFYRDRQFFRKRANRAFELFTTKYWMVDKSRVAAIGIAFGGTTALELARIGARVPGVVAINAALRPERIEDGRRIQGRVLAVHADGDQYVADNELHLFIDEMRAGEVPYELIVYGQAKRGFMQQDAPATVRGGAYDESLAEHTWEIVETFLDSLFD